MLGTKRTGDFVTYILKPDYILPNTFTSFKGAPPFTLETNVHFLRSLFPNPPFFLDLHILAHLTR
jgi:hypothetical protein